MIGLIVVLAMLAGASAIWFVHINRPVWTLASIALAVSLVHLHRWWIH